MTADYLKYRGKCKEESLKLIDQDPTLRLVRGYYHDIFWGKQMHWWCETKSGEIIDPTKLQFPDQQGDYEEFNGVFVCDECGTKFPEADGMSYGRYVLCSSSCMAALVGI